MTLFNYIFEGGAAGHMKGPQDLPIVNTGSDLVKFFEDLVKANIRQRMSEASFEELTTLLHNVSMDNTAATNGTLEVFHDAKQGKPITETLKADEASATAVNVYNDIEDPKILQSLSYLNQIAGLLQAQQASAQEKDKKE